MINATRLTEEQIEKASNWWSEQLRSPRFDNGDDSATGAMCHMMAALSYRSISDEKIDTFKSELKLRMFDCDEFAHIDVDYDPCQILLMSAKAADIDTSITTFPWKTNMCFEDGKVMASLGYRAPFVEVV